MTKVTRQLLLVLFILAAQTASAQFKFGVRAGLNVTHMKLNSSAVKADNQAGFFVGPTVKFSLPIVGLGVDASALYDNRKVKLTDQTTNIETETTQQTIDVPINVRYTLGLSSLVSAFIYAGPQFSYNVGSKHKADWEWKDATKSANVGVGVTVIDHVQLNVNYNFPFEKSLTSAIKGAGKDHTWQIGAAYFF